MTVVANESEPGFLRRIDELVRREAQRRGATFSDLMLRLPSIYPTVVIAALDRLATAGLLPQLVAERVQQQARKPVPRVSDARSLLPVPHPLDYEWRFTADTAHALLNRATDLTVRGGDILLFGTPGVAAEALTLPIARRLAFLAEDNAVTRRVISLNRATGAPLAIGNCSAGLPQDSADAVLLDPPWYMDFVRPMLVAAAAACRSQGVILLSVPPAATRPSAEADRSGTINFAYRLGLELIGDWPLGLSYETPFFETNALAAASLHPPARWRRGDLLIFRKTRPASRPAPATSRRRDWVEVSVGRMRLFIRGVAGDPGGSHGLIPIVSGDVLSSVSRRDPRRRMASVWTSGNRIFRTDNPRLVLEAALSHSSAANGASAQPAFWGTLHEREALDRVGELIGRIAEREADEERGAFADPTEWSEHWTSRSETSFSRSAATIFGGATCPTRPSRQARSAFTSPCSPSRSSR